MGMGTLVDVLVFIVTIVVVFWAFYALFRRES